MIELHDLRGRTALVTGAFGGLGLHFARVLARQGAKVALAARPALLLLDEPFAGLGSSEIADLSALIRRVHADEGLTVVLIEHKLREFMRLVDRVVALDFGEVIAEGLPDEIVRNPAVIEAYIGRESAGSVVASHAA
jgi:ABC-type lipopolysaccharide export system ATPase subunit